MPPPYAPVGNCIFCGRTTYSENEPGRKLGDEHIIPMGFRGTEILRNACCEACERETSQIEHHCIRNQLHAARPHLGLRGRKSRKVPINGPFSATGTQRDDKIPTAQHPGHMIDYRFPFPAYLTGHREIDPKSKTFIHLRPIVNDFESRVVRLGGTIKVTLGASDGVEKFARLLAKIAHVYAVAELGLGSFNAFLPPIILGKQSEFDIYDLIGTSLLDEAASSSLHEVGFDPPTRPINAIVVRIRLFANLRSPPPSHYVVVGTSL